MAKYVRLTDTIYRGGRDVHYGYGDAQSSDIDQRIDAIMSRLGSITDNAGADVSYTYLGRGTVVVEDNVEASTRLSYLDENGVPSRFDRFGRVVDQVWEQYDQNGDVTGEVDHYHYTYNRAGDRTSKLNERMTDQSLDEVYTYDNLDRLTGWTRGGVSQETWTLDSLGNNLNTSTGGTYNAANEQVTIANSSVSPTYDAAGNMTTLSTGKTAKYDAWDRLVLVTDGSGTSATNVEKCEYDGTNRRIQIFAYDANGNPTTVEDDYYSGQQVIESHHSTPGGSLQGAEAYVWSPRYIDSAILRDSYDANGDRIADARVLYLADANYNVTGLLKVNQQTNAWEVAERDTYTPYGEVQYRDNVWGTVNSSANSNTILYTGRVWDTLTNLYYYRARYYDAVMQRFVNRDPAESSPNLYEYCGDGPIIAVDPHGLYIENYLPFEPAIPQAVEITPALRDKMDDLVTDAQFKIIGQSQPGDVCSTWKPGGSKCSLRVSKNNF